MLFKVKPTKKKFKGSHKKWVFCKTIADLEGDEYSIFVTNWCMNEYDWSITKKENSKNPYHHYDNGGIMFDRDKIKYGRVNGHHKAWKEVIKQIKMLREESKNLN